MTHIRVSKIIIIGLDNGLSPGWHQSIISSNAGIWSILTNLRNKFQWNLQLSSYILIQQNAFENVVCEMVAILFRPQWVKAINMALSTSCIWRHICCIMNGLADCHFAAHGITLPKYYVIFMNRHGPYPIHMQRFYVIRLIFERPFWIFRISWVNIWMSLPCCKTCMICICTQHELLWCWSIYD